MAPSQDGQKQRTVHQGHKPDVYTEWEGENGAQAQTRGYPDAVHKKFASVDAAMYYVVTGTDPITPVSYYAVAHGHVPSVYTSWAAVEKQTTGYGGNLFQKCSSLEAAKKFVADRAGVEEADVKVFENQNHFANFKNFAPDAKNTFEEEFDRLALSQGWQKGTPKFDMQRVIALRRELEYHYFAQGDEEPNALRSACPNAGLLTLR